MSVPRVSIGLPVYNGGATFRASVESLLGQTFADFELIISDNASADSTESVAREFAARDSRVRYERNSVNIGIAANFNRVFSLARAPLFKWATSDDVCLPEFLARCVEILDHRPDVVLVYPRTQFIDATGAILAVQDTSWHLPQDSPAERLRFVISTGQWVNSIEGVIRREALLRTRLFRTYPGSDYSLLAELSLRGKFFEVPAVLYHRRLHPQSMSQHLSEPAWRLNYWGNRLGTFMPRWARSFDSLRTIFSSGLSPGKKLALGREVVRFMSGQRESLWREIRAGARRLAHLPANPSL